MLAKTGLARVLSSCYLMVGRLHDHLQLIKFLRPQASFHTTARRVAKPIHIFTTSPVLYTVLYIFPSAMGKLCFYVYPVYFPVVENATF